MAEVATPIPQPAAKASLSRRAAPSTVAIPVNSNTSNRGQFLGLEAFSPVNQNGSFEFDRVIMSGEVNKRSRKTKQWKRFYLVLRPTLLSVYKNRSEEKLLKQLNLADITAVAVLKDPRGRRNHMFGVFSPSRNLHFQANSDVEARAWVDCIKREARVDEEEQQILYGSPGFPAPVHQSLDQYILSGDEGNPSYDRQMSSSPEPLDFPSSYTTTRDGVRIPGIETQSGSQQNLEYSGPEHASYSDFSDSAPPRLQLPSHITAKATATAHNPDATKTTFALSHATNSTIDPSPRPSTTRNASGTSVNALIIESERVIYHGYLLCLKWKGGVRQWKRLWTVLRPKNLAFYKNEEEYAARLLIPLSSILSAVEIDPVSRTKAHCMQIIAEEKSYRFCAPSEEALARWLGALKSQLARRKGKEKEKGKEAGGKQA